MGIHTSEAIVLRSYAFRETSVIVTCLTDGAGKLRGIIKGLRRQPNRYRSAMEPLSINRIVYYDTRTSHLHLISQCDLVNPLADLQRDLATARVAALCAELTDAVAPLEEPQPLVYRLLKQTLERLTVSTGELESVRVHFILRLLRLAGFQPQLDECTGCGAMIHAEGFWSAPQGGLLCRSCLHEDPKAEAAQPEFLDTLETLSDAELPQAIAAPRLELLSRRLTEFLRWRIDHPLKTLTT